MIQRVRQYPQDEAKLREPAAPVGEVSDTVYEFAYLLVAAMRQLDGLGLAATQVEAPAFQRSPAVFVMAPTKTSSVILIDPVILARSGRAVEEEGCLSFRGVLWPLPAPTSVRVQYTTVDGVRTQDEFTGWMARCAFHEVDHLAGKLMIDRMAKWERRKFLKQLQEHRP